LADVVCFGSRVQFEQVGVQQQPHVRLTCEHGKECPAEVDGTVRENAIDDVLRVETERWMFAAPGTIDERARRQAAKVLGAAVPGCQLVMTDRPTAERDPVALFEIAWRKRDAAATPEPATAAIHPQAA